MANIVTRAQAAPAATHAFASLTGLVSSLVHWNETRRTRAALGKLSNHELDDIGLTRGDIDQIGR